MEDSHLIKHYKSIKDIVNSIKVDISAAENWYLQGDENSIDKCKQIYYSIDKIINFMFKSNTNLSEIYFEEKSNNNSIN